MNELMNKYAEIILKVGVNIDEGQPLLITSPIECSDFVKILIEKAYKLGASRVEVDWFDNDIIKLKYNYEKINNFKSIENYIIEKNKNQINKNYAFLKISATDSKAMEGVDQEKIIAWQKTVNEFLKFKTDATMNDRVSWCVVPVPTLKWAKEIFPKSQDPIKELWETIFTLTRTTEKESIIAWQEHIWKLKKYATYLNEQKFEYLTFKNSLGTDLKVGLVKNYLFLAAESVNNTTGRKFTANIPTEEVFSMPDCNNVEGIVFSSKPLNYNGQLIDEFWLEFKKGEVVDFDAKIGKEALTSLLSVDEGAKKIGEVALVGYNTPISMSNILFYSTLLDENASCHLALGKAYPTCVENGENKTEDQLKLLGSNESAIHVDFMFGTEDLAVHGLKEDITIEILKNGNFCI